MILERRGNTRVNEPISYEKFMYHIEALIIVNPDNAVLGLEKSPVWEGGGLIAYQCWLIYDTVALI